MTSSSLLMQEVLKMWTVLHQLQCRHQIQALGLAFKSVTLALVALALACHDTLTAPTNLGSTPMSLVPLLSPVKHSMLGDSV